MLGHKKIAPRREITDAPNLSRLLRLGGERRGEEATRDQRHEGAPLHRWFLPNAVSESGATRGWE
jgi:hypothetical protein